MAVLIGELSASLRYLSQRFGMPDKKSKAILNDVGTEELAHLEMVGTLVHQLTDGASPQEMEAAGLGAYYTDHGWGVYYLTLIAIGIAVMSLFHIPLILKNKTLSSEN